ncbi:DivIVA domain-containing protein [Micromonospora okii]|uniref:DivIVA domain-containing protein n=1 Tax=Micromonospora okii TaxID=1182970 RepID=UPI001E48B159|nr:DivIVA domain-containing protein [Micromonospora okii]
MEPNPDEPPDPTDAIPSPGIGRATAEGGVYRSRRNLLTPADIRRQCFPMTGFGRRGLDPEAVGRFLGQVEADLEALYREIVAARDEASYYRDTAAELRAERWRLRTPWAPRPRNEYRRPPMCPPYSRQQPGGHRRADDGRGDG